MSQKEMIYCANDTCSKHISKNKTFCNEHNEKRCDGNKYGNPYDCEPHPAHELTNLAHRCDKCCKKICLEGAAIFHFKNDKLPEFLCWDCFESFEEGSIYNVKSDCDCLSQLKSEHCSKGDVEMYKCGSCNLWYFC